MVLNSDKAAEKIKAGALILDVRTEDEYIGGFYPGAVNIPLSVLPARLSELEPRSRSILTYCSSGVRGAMAANLLQAFGWPNAYCMGSLDDIPKIQ